MFHDTVCRGPFQSTFPQNSSTGRPKYRPSDEEILVDWSTNLSENYSTVEAASSTAALDMVVKAIGTELDSVTGGKAEWHR